MLLGNIGEIKQPTKEINVRHFLGSTPAFLNRSKSSGIRYPKKLVA